jgi:hypothetical protein
MQQSCRIFGNGWVFVIERYAWPNAEAALRDALKLLSLPAPDDGLL